MQTKLKVSQLEEINPKKYSFFEYKVREVNDEIFEIILVFNYMNKTGLYLTASEEWFKTWDEAQTAIDVLNFTPTHEMNVFVEEFNIWELGATDKLGVTLEKGYYKICNLSDINLDNKVNSNDKKLVPLHIVSLESYNTFKEAMDALETQTFTDLRGVYTQAVNRGEAVSKPKVMKSNSGYYIGTSSTNFVNYRPTFEEHNSRISDGYFKTYDEAFIALLTGRYGERILQ